MSSVSNQSSALHRPLLAPITVPPQSSFRQKREAPAPFTMAEGSRVEGDRKLAMEYVGVLLLPTYEGQNTRVSHIPPHSTFGQWWGQLQNAFESPDVAQWIRDKGIDSKSIRLNPKSGQVTFNLNSARDPLRTLRTVGQDDPHWAAISGPILEAARVIVAEHADTTLAPQILVPSEPVPWSLVGRFYNEQQGLTTPSKLKRAKEIVHAQGFTQLDPSTSADLITSRSEDSLQEQKAVLADILDRQRIITALQDLVLSVNNGTFGHIQNELNRMVDLSPDGTYQTTSSGPSKKASLRQLLVDYGWDVPTNAEELQNLATSLSTPARYGPANGNLGGALAWPVPLDQDSQVQLRADIRTGKLGDSARSPSDNVLDYLLSERPVSAEERSNPRLLIDALVTSSKGIALGHAIQASFEARGVKGSASDWLLAALNMGNSRGVETDRQTPGEIEGYRLVSAENTGKSCAAIIKELAEHLVAEGKASSPENAAIKAHMLLASQAPEFLVKGIPEQVTVGTHSWVSFATATARIEAKAPGATAAMSYAHIMLAGSIAPVSEEERHVEFAAQNEAIKSWGVANGMGYPVTEAAIKMVREAFSAQVRELKEAAETQLTEMPTTKAIALEQLKKALPNMNPSLFENKCITSQPSSRHFPGPYSILDMYIDGRGLRGAPDSADDLGGHGRGFLNTITLGLVTIAKDGKPAVWVSSSNQINVNNVLATVKDLPRPLDAFKEAYPGFANAVKKTTSAQLKLLISKLPLEDRQDLEFGKLTMLKEIHHHGTNTPQNRVAEGVLLVKTERNGNVMVYEIDRLKGTVTKLPGKGVTDHHRGGFGGSIRFDEVRPEGQHSAGITDENKDARGAPNSFSSSRTHYIVDAMIKDMDLPAVEQYARGETTFDTEVPTHEKVTRVASEIALNLIPFRSAIKNFKDGKAGEGIADLAFDIFGFAVGLGAAAKGAKAFAVGASAVSKAAQVGKIIGRSAIGALNPLGGIDDVLRSAARVVKNGLGAGYRGIQQLRGSHRNINLLELAKSPNLAEGTFKASNSSGEISTLGKFDEKTGKWFNYNAATGKTYGKAIEGFKPQQLPKIDDPITGAAAARKTTDQMTLLEQGLTTDNVIQLGGAMKEFKVIDSEVHVFYDVYKGTDRLNIVAHGNPYVSNKKIFSRNNANIEINDKSYSAAELVELLKSKGVDPKKFDNVRLLICHSAEGGSRSFGAQMQKVIKKPVKAFEGSVTVSYNSTAVTNLRNASVDRLKKNNPDIPDAYAQYLANDDLRKNLVGRATPVVNKDNGSVIKINIAGLDEKPNLVTLPVTYQPKKFG